MKKPSVISYEMICLTLRILANIVYFLLDLQPLINTGNTDKLKINKI